MSESETGKFIRMACWIVLVMALMFTVSEKISSYQRARGVAISQYLLKQHKIVVSAEQAKYLTVGTDYSTFDVVVKDCNIFPK